MISFICKPAGPRSLRRVLSAALGLAAATALCAADSGPAYRIGILKGNTLSVKENALNASWVVEAENVSSFLLEGDRIGVRRQDGAVLVKAGGLSAPWVQVAQQSQSFGLSGNRIAVLSPAGGLDVKEGALNARWVRVAEGTRDFQLQGRRIGILMSGGALQMLDGSPGTTMVHETDNVQSFQLSGQRLGVLYRNGGLDVKEGGIDAPWVHEADGVRSFYLEGNRIGALRGNSLDVKEGGLDAPWVREAERVDSFILNGDSMAMLQGSVLTVKSGRLDASWTWQSADVQKYQLHGPRIAIQKRDGTFSVKEEGMQSASWVWMSGGVRMFQIAVTFETGSYPAADDFPAPADTPLGWQRDIRRGMATTTVQLESPPGRAVGWSKQVEVVFPAGYTYCSHSLSANRRGGPGGVTIVSADANRLVFGVWTGGARDRSDDRSASPARGGVQITATVTGVRSGSRNNRSCTALPAAGGGCGEENCGTYLDAGENDNGLCLPAACRNNRPGRADRQVCVYNLRDDDQADERARQLACRGNGWSELPADWQRGAGRGEVTKTLQLESPRGGSDGRTSPVEVLFPAGYSYCRHTLSNVTRTGPSGVSIIAAEPGRLVFGVWSGRPPDGSGAGRVQATATVTVIRANAQRDMAESSSNQYDDSRTAGACDDLPEAADGGCGEQSCTRFLDAAESDNGLCQPATCGDGRIGRMEQPVCVYNLRSDAQTQSRARRLVCRNYTNRINPDRN